MEFLRDFAEHLDPDALYAVAWIVAVFMASAIYRRIMGKPIRPRAPSNSRFVETWTSGRSLHNLITRLGGARGCLLVAVTPTSLEIHPHFPFTLMFLPEIYGLDVKIPLSRIREVRTERSFLRDRQVVVFSNENGQTERVELVLKKGPEFRVAVAK